MSCNKCCDYSRAMKCNYDLACKEQAIDALHYARKHCTKDMSPEECANMVANRKRIAKDGTLPQEYIPNLPGCNLNCKEPYELEMTMSSPEGHNPNDYYSLDNAYGNWKEAFGEDYGGTGISVSAAIRGPISGPESGCMCGTKEGFNENFGAFSLAAAVRGGCSSCRGGGAVKYIPGVF
jgi:hypothetical protein